jgi:phosphosulfolactate phosphohydrolase-like enzyme
MLATSENEMAGTILFGSLSNAAAVAMEQCSAQHRAFIVNFFNGDTVDKKQGNFSSISILFVMKKFLAAVLYSYG